MSSSHPDDPATGAVPGAAGAAAGAQPPSEEELRAAYEAELDRIDAIDMIAQAAVSLLNIGARRLGPPSPPPGAAPDPSGPPGPAGAPDPAGRDLQQAGDAIDAARALLAILERRIPEETKPLKDALSRLQMAYASEVGASRPAPGGAAASSGPSEPGPSEPGPAPGAPPAAPEQAQDPKKPGPAESSGRLWVPGR